MKSFKLLSILVALAALTSCEAVKQATNTTGGSVFSLNGQWQLSSNSPENTLLNSIVTVSPFISEGKLTYVSNNTQCFRQDDIKWKNIKSDNIGGYNLDNLISNCSSGSLNYEPAVIYVVNNNQIRITGRNAAGHDNTQNWSRVK